MDRGVIYYNRGTSCTVRLLVSTYTLRRFYRGPITILSEGEDSHFLCERIAPAVDATVKRINLGVEGRNAAYLTKCKLHEVAPYRANLFIDADTLIVGSIDELFPLIEEHTFMGTHMANWETARGLVSRRIKKWKPWYPDFVKPALRYGKAINTGVYGFTLDAPLMKDWFGMAFKGRELFIPDETCCQLMVPQYPHVIADHRFNCSCKYDNPDDPDIRVIHYHGRKHCRIDLPYHGDKWIKIFGEVSSRDVAGINTWMPAGDRMLKKYLIHLGMDIK